MRESVVVRGARTHNLRNASLSLPHGRLIVFTGVSGSGKSSLAFDTLYAEGQRRYVASLSNYARQFLDQLPRPDVDSVTGIPPALSIDQKSIGRNPRSTVGTLTEIYDFLRVIWARAGRMHCPACGAEVGAQSRETIVRRAAALQREDPLLFLAPLVRDQRGSHRDLLGDLRRRGFLRARCDGAIVRTDQTRQLDPGRRHNIDVVVDRVGREPVPDSRLWEAVDTALGLGKGRLVLVPEGGEDVPCSTAHACPKCGRSCEEPTPAAFSFNIPQGWCPACQGLGTAVQIVEEWLIPDAGRSIAGGALAVAGAARLLAQPFEAAARHLGFDLDTPWVGLDAAQRRAFLHGIDDPIRMPGRRRPEPYPGAIALLEDLMLPGADGSPGPGTAVPPALGRFAREGPCPACRGARLRPESLAVTVAGRTIAEAASLTLGDLRRFLATARLGDAERAIVGEALAEADERLRFLGDVGVDYLSCDRSAPTLAGGEAQRIRLAAQVGRGLSGVLYVLDEPSIGLHQRDNRRLISTLRALRDRGSTVVVVEHDEETIRSADLVVDFGPGAGAAGGEVVAVGRPEDLEADPRSVTGRYLAGRESIPVPERRRAGGPGLRIVDARQHNLQGITVDIPSGALTCVTGVSGSGKSSLVADVLLDNLQRALGGWGWSGQVPAPEDPDEALAIAEEAAAPRRRRGRAAAEGGRGARAPEGAGPNGRRGAAAAGGRPRFDGPWTGCARIEGWDRFDKVIAIDQSPIGRIPRSNPATYTKVWDLVRALYAQLPEARVRGYAPGRFSFNVAGGRCPACEGNGARRIDMEFLPDAWVECEACRGARFTDETLQVRFRGRSIAEVLGMTVDAALEHFAEMPQIRRYLQTMADVGLGYMQLGQPSPTLSGGEAQRIKLSRELAKRSTGRTLYVLDEPTTGLHFRDVAHLLAVLQRLVDAGNTVVVVEHNLDVIKVADRVVDLGPEGGAAGGRLVAAGTPEELARARRSLTGLYLRELLRDGRLRAQPDRGAEAAGAPGSEAAAGAEEPAAIRDGAPPSPEAIVVVGARQNNLCDVSVRLPKEQVVAFAGPSGAGKTSLALDTIYAEGQRRYVESLSAYARQFLGRAQRPAVDRVDGLCPAIAVDQRAVPPNARSTVATLTEIYDYLRLLLARAGEPRCPDCGGAVAWLGGDRIADLAVQAFPERRVVVLAPAEAAGGDLEDWRARHLRAGYARYWADGVVHALDDGPAGQRHHRDSRDDGHDRDVRDDGDAGGDAAATGGQGAPRVPGLALVVDRADTRDPARLREAVEAAFAAAEGVARDLVGFEPEDGPARWWRRGYACVGCGLALPALLPHTFAFNDPRGWCPICEGTGAQRRGQWETLVPDPGLSIAAGGVGVWGPVPGGPMSALLSAIGRRHGFDMDTPLGSFTPRQREVLLGGDPEPAELDLGGGLPTAVRFAGLWAGLERARSQSHAGQLVHGVAALFTDADCPSCAGSRVAPQGRNVLLGGRTLPEIVRMTLGEARAFFADLRLPDTAAEACGELLAEIRGRLHFLCEVGLDYLTLGTASAALSGGEGQRIRLASQLGASLTGVLYVLDEPTVGLHPRDTERLAGTLRGLRDLGNTVLAVDHDEQLLAQADHLVVFGPGSGSAGGRIVAQGSPDEVPHRALRGQAPPPVAVSGADGRGTDGPRARTPGRRAAAGRGEARARDGGIPGATGGPPLPPVGGDWRRRPQKGWIVVEGARHHNLRGIDCALPLGNFVAVTGVSGSGKTSLVIDTLYHALARRLHRAQAVPGPHDRIAGIDQVDKVIHVDQAPVSETPRSNAATYTGVFDVLRRLYARVPEARARGFDSDHFSYNHPQGRCDHCEGYGQRRIQMHFLPDVWVPCEACAGRRYRSDVLDILYRGRSIADCLEMTVADACAHFAALRSIRPALETLCAVGLGYLRLGQPAPTLSAGEAQRLKLGRELSRPATGRTLFVLDEPTTGLSSGEVAHLLGVLQRLVDGGNTVVCIEHNLDVMAAADWIVDLGPEGGPAGGRIVAQGPPEAVARGVRIAAGPGAGAADATDGARAPGGGRAAESRTAPFLAARLGMPPAARAAGEGGG